MKKFLNLDKPIGRFDYFNFGILSLITIIVLLFNTRRYMIDSIHIYILVFSLVLIVYSSIRRGVTIGVGIGKTFFYQFFSIFFFIFILFLLLFFTEYPCSIKIWHIYLAFLPFNIVLLFMRNKQRTVVTSVWFLRYLYRIIFYILWLFLSLIFFVSQSSGCGGPPSACVLLKEVTSKQIDYYHEDYGEYPNTLEVALQKYTNKRRREIGKQCRRASFTKTWDTNNIQYDKIKNGYILSCKWIDIYSSKMENLSQYNSKSKSCTITHNIQGITSLYFYRFFCIGF